MRYEHKEMQRQSSLDPDLKFGGAGVTQLCVGLTESRQPLQASLHYLASTRHAGTECLRLCAETTKHPVIKVVAILNCSLKALARPRFFFSSPISSHPHQCQSSEKHRFQAPKSNPQYLPCEFAPPRFNQSIIINNLLSLPPSARQR